MDNLLYYNEFVPVSLDDINLKLGYNNINIISLCWTDSSSYVGAVIKSISSSSRKPGTMLYIVGRHGIINKLTIKHNYTSDADGTRILCPSNTDYLINGSYFGVCLIYNGTDWRILGR